MSSKVKYVMAFAVLALVLVLARADIACAKIKSGDWGIEKENMMYWRYDTKTKVLTIEGTGRMWVGRNNPGWYPKASDAKKAVMKGPIKDVGELCFDNFHKLESVVLPDTIEEIGVMAFYDTGKLKKIKLPPNLKKIGKYAFEGSGIEEISIPDGVKKIEVCAFFDDCNLKKVKLGKYTEILCLYAFWGNHKLKHIKLPGCLKSIKDRVFGYTGLKSITIPKNVKEIGEGVFLKTKKLKKVTIKSHKIKKWGKDIFYGDEQEIIVEVPKVKYLEYRKAIHKSGAGENIKVVANEKL